MYPQGEDLIIENQHVNELVLITDGYVTLGPVEQSTGDQKCYLEFRGKSYFGEYELLTSDPAFSTARAQGKTNQGFCIMRRDFLKTIYLFPDIRTKLLAEARNRQREMKKAIELERRYETNETSPAKSRMSILDMQQLLSKAIALKMSKKQLEEIKKKPQEHVQEIAQDIRNMQNMHCKLEKKIKKYQDKMDKMVNKYKEKL